MLLERDLIQSTGFRNVREGDAITGFQFRVRMQSYRGMAASLIDGIAVRVGDLVDVGPEVPLWTFGGRTYRLHELWESDGLRWQLEEPGIVTVPFPGGLPDGIHEVSVELRLRMSYIPIEHQPSVFRATKHITLISEQGGGPFRYGVSLYSFMHDYGTVLDLETALAAVADVGATGVEILGEGHVANYPEPSTAWVDAWFGLLEKYSLEPTNYGSWIDTRLHPGRGMTPQEGAAAIQRDLRLAKQLGFRFVRPKIGVVSSDLVPDPIWTESVERSLDLAAELDVVICPEIHSPTPIKHPVVDDYIDLIERTGTKHFGLLIDTGIFQDRPIPLRAGRDARDAAGVPRRHRRRSRRPRRHRRVHRLRAGEVPRHRRQPRRPADPVGARAPRPPRRRVQRLPLQRVRGRPHAVALARADPPPAFADAPGRLPALNPFSRTGHDMPNGLLSDDSLRTHPDGLALSLTLPWYRSLWLSSVGTLRVTIDGAPVARRRLTFELAGERYALDELPRQSEVLWYLQEHPLADRPS